MTDQPTSYPNVTPSRPLTLRAPIEQASDFDRFVEALTELQLPARVTDEVNGNGTGFVHGTILVSEDDEPLQAVGDGVTLSWRPVSATTVKIALATALNGTVHFDEVEYHLGDDDGDDERTCPPASGVLENFVWWTPEFGEIGGVLARRAGQPLHLVRDGDTGLFAPTGSADDVFESGVWAAAGSVAMWRQGGSRVAAIGVKRDVLLHTWDQNWRRLDPTPHLRDVDGLTVSDYLDRLDDTDLDAADWSEALRLDADRAQQLRILFRRDDSDERTFARLAEILSTPPALADVADGRIGIDRLPGSTVAQPSSTWSTIRRAMSEELSGDRSSSAAPKPPTGWVGHRRRRSGAYLAVAALIFVALSAVLVTKIVTSSTDTVWVQGLLLVALVADVAWPRGRDRGDENAG
jgi:hypothetical protein